MEELKEGAYMEFSHWGERVRITTDHHDIDIEEAFEMFKRLLLGSGFSQNQIDEFLECK